jgi:hypothetical protein
MLLLDAGALRPQRAAPGRSRTQVGRGRAGEPGRLVPSGSVGFLQLRAVLLGRLPLNVNR